MIFEYLRERYAVTEYKDGCVYRTKSLGEIWTRESEIYKIVNDEFFAPLSTKRMKELNFQTMRKVKELEPC